MKIVRHTDANFAAKLRELTAPSSLFDPVIEQRTRAILDAVQVRGDDALLELPKNSMVPGSPPTGWLSRRRNYSTPRSPPMNRCAEP